MTSDDLPSLKRRLSVYESELLAMDRSRDELREAIIQVRMEIHRREKEAAYVRKAD